MTPQEELDLIERTKQGDNNAFEALVEENQKKVYNLALKLTGDENDALDLSQDALIKAYLNLGSFRGDCRFSVWIYRLTYNCCIDFIRKRRRAQQGSLTYIGENGDLADLEIPDTRMNPESEVERRELRRAIDEGIGQLSEEHRRIFLLRQIAGMTYEEIALTLHISEGTVKSRLSRARQNLAKNLVESGTISPADRQNKGKEVNLHDEL
jgi:RNA polymerase sigma-70 factor (ECF subfamily)